MISDGSCDTEHWSNDAENSALPSGINYYILKYIQIENSLYFIILLFYDMSFKNIKKILQTSNFWTVMYFGILSVFDLCEIITGFYHCVI